MKRTLYLFIASISLLVGACQPGDVQPDPVLIQSTAVASYSNAVLHTITSTNDSLTYQPGQYALTIQRITYRTTLEDGTPIVASGVIYLPTLPAGSAKPLPMLSYQHPTAFSESEVPSGYDYTQARFSYPLYFATHGYIVACPDYIGYGDAKGIAHPYENRATLAQATVNMIRATGEWLDNTGVVWNKQVFMAGFSEGGYATLSAQELIEKQYAGELTLSGTSCGAGPYAMATFFDYITHQPTSSPGIVNYLYTWQTLVYNKLYNGNKPLSYYFNAPYADLITESLENARLFTVSFDQLCTDQFRADVRNPSSAFGKALLSNDLTGWAARTRTYLIHGDQDEVIPYFISQKTCDLMKLNGASQTSLVTLKNLRHVPSEIMFMRRTIDLFEPLKK